MNSSPSPAPGEPRQWQRESDTLTVVTDAKTDFWRETHYGFIRDNGHAFLADHAGDFTAQIRVQAKFSHLYDQAGLMIRLDDRNWVKFGVEYNDGKAAVSAVVTLPHSDWSTGPFEGDQSIFWLRATISDGILRLQMSPDGKTWPMIRLCQFPQAKTYKIGPMCCTPQRAGLRVTFSQWLLRPPLIRDLHDLT